MVCFPSTKSTEDKPLPQYKYQKDLFCRQKWEAELRRQMQQRRPREEDEEEPEDPNWDQPDNKRQMIEKIKREPALITTLPLDVAAMILVDLSFPEINRLGQTSPEVSTYINNNLLWHKIYNRKYLPWDPELFTVTPDLRAWFDRRGGVQWRWLCYIAEETQNPDEDDDNLRVKYMAMRLYDENDNRQLEEDVTLRGRELDQNEEAVDILITLTVWIFQDGRIILTHVRQDDPGDDDEYLAITKGLGRQAGGQLEQDPGTSEVSWTFTGPREHSYQGFVRFLCMLFYTGWKLDHPNPFRPSHSLRSQIGCAACKQPNAQFKEQGTGRVFCGTKCQKKMY